MMTNCLIKLMVGLFFIGLATNESLGQEKLRSQTDSLHQKLNTVLSDSNRVDLLFRLNSSVASNDPEKALSYAKQGFELATKIGYKHGMMICINDIATIQLDMGNNAEAIKNQEKALALAKELKNKEITIGSYMNIGAVYQRVSQYSKAADYFFMALKKAEAENDNKFIALSETNIATLFIQQRNFEKAKYYALRADKIFQKLNLKTYEAKNLEMLGNCYAFDGKKDLAKPYYQKALRIYQETENELGKAIIYTQMVDLYSDDPIKQIDYLNKAKNIWDRTAPNNLNAIANIGNFGFVYFEVLKDPEKLKKVEERLHLNKEKMLADAEVYFAKSIAMSEKAGITDLVLQLALPYSQLCEYKKDYKGALDNLKKYGKLQDSVYSQQIKNKIASLDSEREIAIRDKELQLNKLELKQLWLYAILIVLALISVLLFLYNKYRIRQLRFKNALQQQEADQQHRELSYKNQLSESELKAIRSQMNPHFIFNVLNSIESYIMDNDKKTASRLIQKFAALSRLILENSTKSLVTADREWKAIKLYTELEAMRYNNAFAYEFKLDEGIELKELLLPPMLIQPLIENAILHGLIVDNQPNAYLEVRLEKNKTGICITVQDNGKGYHPEEKKTIKIGVKEQSMGIESIRERIENINLQNQGTIASFHIGINENNRGTIAVLCLPASYTNVA